MNTDKKVSFGFSKLTKKPTVYNKPAKDKKIELVECFEGKSMKIKDAVEVVVKPLVIPIKDNNKNLFDRIKTNITNQKENVKKDFKEGTGGFSSELTIEELAAQELIREAKNRLEKRETADSNLILPIKEDRISFEDKEESRLEDYENVPISDYGLAMLRGMGWKEGMSIGKNSAKVVSPSVPELRPKGLGLGATKIINSDISSQTACDKDGNVLILKLGTSAKVVGGPHKGTYCEVLGFDDEAGRVIVKTSVKGEILIINEFFIVPVMKEEYSKNSKILNNSKYEEYMENAGKKLKNYKESSSKNKLEKHVQEQNDRKFQMSHACNNKLTNIKYESDQSLRRSDKNIEHSNKQASSYMVHESSNSDSELEVSRKKPEYQRRSRSPQEKGHKSDKKSSENKYYNKDYKKSHHRKRKKEKKSKSKSRYRSRSSSTSNNSDI